jgi:hypothetical protein
MNDKGVNFFIKHTTGRHPEWWRGGGSAPAPSSLHSKLKLKNILPDSPFSQNALLNSTDK